MPFTTQNTHTMSRGKQLEKKKWWKKTKRKPWKSLRGKWWVGNTITIVDTFLTPANQFPKIVKHAPRVSALPLDPIL